MYSIPSPWHRLSSVVVGSAWSPQLFDWVEDADIRTDLDIIAQETQEDLDALADKLISMGIEVLRPNMAAMPQRLLPPVAPRDDLLMLENRFFVCDSDRSPTYQHIIEHVQSQGNTVLTHSAQNINGANVFDRGDIVFWGLDSDDLLPDAVTWLKSNAAHRQCFKYYALGHLDGWWSAPIHGLVVSNIDTHRPNLQNFFFSRYFADCEVILLNETFTGRPNTQWFSSQHLPDSKFARWVNTNLSSWLGQVDETCFEINLLPIDRDLVLTAHDHPAIRAALKEKGCHLEITPLRHQTFWDLGLHCATADLARVS